MTNSLVHRLWQYACIVIASLTISMVTACQSSAPPPSAPDLSFTRYQPIHMNVADIKVIEEYHSPMREPNVEHLLPISPADAMHIWVKDRLRATGANRFMEVIIKDASVIASPLPKPGGVTGFFTDSQDKRYDVKLMVEMRIYDTGNAMSQASVQVSASQSITINEGASLAERKAIFRKLIFNVMESINAELEKNMFAYFSSYINYAQMP